jgi:hypothetical protein
MAENPDLKGWVEAMARDLVNMTEAVGVRQFEDRGTEVLELEVDPSEMGRIIGRQGRTVQALRTLLQIAGDRHGRAYDLEIVE